MRLNLSALFIALLMTTACEVDKGGTTPTPIDTQISASSKNKVRFKRNERLRNDYALQMDLPINGICNEFGLYSCTDLVHAVALGGVAPYNLSITRPPDKSGSTAPMIVDRVALAACVQAVDRDLGQPGSAVMFGGLDIDGSGNLVDPDGADVTEAIHNIYKRSVQREARANELASIRGFYTDVASRSNNAARDWAVASCFAVFTTTEALFY